MLFTVRNAGHANYRLAALALPARKTFKLSTFQTSCRTRTTNITSSQGFAGKEGPKTERSETNGMERGERRTQASMIEQVEFPTLCARALCAEKLSSRLEVECDNFLLD